MSKATEVFQVAEVNQPFIEAIGDNKVRFNFTMDALLEVLGNTVDLRKLNGAAMLATTLAAGVVKGLSGAPSSESVTQTDRPIGDKWKDCTEKLNTKGTKTTFTRKLDAQEKKDALEAHVDFRIRVLYGEAELQSRTTNVHPLGEELRLVLFDAILASGMCDSEGSKWTAKTIPSVFAKTASSLTSIESAGAAIGIGPKMLESLLSKAIQILDNKNLDGMLDGMDMSV